MALAGRRLRTRRSTRVPLGAELSDGVEGRVDGLPLFDAAFVVGLVVDATLGAQDHWYGEQARVLSSTVVSGSMEAPCRAGC